MCFYSYLKMYGGYSSKTGKFYLTFSLRCLDEMHTKIKHDIRMSGSKLARDSIIRWTVYNKITFCFGSKQDVIKITINYSPKRQIMLTNWRDKSLESICNFICPTSGTVDKAGKCRSPGRWWGKGVWGGGGAGHSYNWLIQINVYNVWKIKEKK